MNIWTYLHQTLPFKPGHSDRKQTVPKGWKKGQETQHKAKYGGGSNAYVMSHSTWGAQNQLLPPFWRHERKRRAP